MAHGHDLDQPPLGITVTGSGRAAQAPDVFVMTLVAQARAEGATVVMRRAAETLDRIRSAALQHGVPREQLVTSNMALNSVYDQPETLICELTLQVRSGDIGRAGELVAACVEAGGDGTRLSGTSFEHSDPTALLVSARRAAFADALARGTELAALARRKLGRVERITEAAPAWAPFERGAVTAMSASGPTVDEGTLGVGVSVTVSWVWADRV